MRTRNADKPKPTTAVKQTPPAKKSASKTPRKPAELSPERSVTPKSTGAKRALSTRGKQVKTNEIKAIPTPETAVAEAKASSDAVQVTPETKTVSVKKVTRVVKRKVVRKKTPTSAKAASRDTPKSGDSGKEKVEESSKEEVEDVINEGFVKNKEVFHVNVEVSENKEELPVEHVEKSIQEDCNVPNDDEPSQMEVVGDLHSLGVDVGISSKQDHSVVTDAGISSKQEDHVVVEDVKSLEIQQSSMVTREEKAEDVVEKTEIVEEKMENTSEPINIEKNISEELEGDEPPEEKDVEHRDEKNEEHAGLDIHEEPGREELAEDNVAEHGEEAQREQEQAELTALAKERKIKKELEIFVGGLDRDAVEEDVNKVFQHIGEVVEVRVHKDPSNSKNKGYAFVKFATKEQASRALAEMRNPVINGKRCGTAPSEDNDTLFLGNICNTWTKEAIRQKLKDYGIEGVENITLVSDPQREGLSRGFAFLEFSCHGDAMLAYKRLQKPDVIFGHLERTAKVAFAEPLREPDPEVMVHVKSVFVDGLPPQWNEDHVRDLFKGYGEIERIMLARNMSTSKRKDFGFVDFTTHEAAIACIDDINSRELGDGNSKAKVRARLSNPLPKTQAVKGEMCGGFRIGSASSGSLPHIGRGFGRGGHPFNRTNFQRNRGLYHHGRGQASRIGFANDHNLDESFRGRQSFGQGGRWGSFRGAHQASGRGTMPARFNGDRPRHDAVDRGHEWHMHFMSQPFAPEEFNRPFLGRHYDDPYLYNDRAHGIKRPFFTDQDPNYMEPSRVRPRLDYPDPAVSIPGTHYRDTFGTGSSMYSHDYYGSDYGGDTYSSFYRGDRPYGGGYY